MKKIILLLSAVLFTTGFANICNAALTPVSVNIIPPVQFPPDDFTVAGVRLSLIGHQRNMYGIDVGILGNTTDLEFVGIAVAGGYNYTSGSTTALGMQLAGLGNYNSGKTSVYGLQAAILANVNKAEAKVVGLQLAIANLADHTNIYGVQAGIYNEAAEVYGLQIGLVNVANNLHGIQIGLANFNHKGPFIVSPILNVGF